MIEYAAKERMENIIISIKHCISQTCRMQDFCVVLLIFYLK